jgi:hypothetical protein
LEIVYYIRSPVGKLIYYFAAHAHASLLNGKAFFLPETALSHKCISHQIAKFFAARGLEGKVILSEGSSL